MKGMREISLQKGGAQRVINNPLHNVGNTKRWRSTSKLSKADILKGILYEPPIWVAAE